MKKVLFLLLTLPVFGLNAQIFINTNPNAKTTVKETKTVAPTTRTSGGVSVKENTNTSGSSTSGIRMTRTSTTSTKPAVIRTTKPAVTRTSTTTTRPSVTRTSTTSTKPTVTRTSTTTTNTKPTRSTNSTGTSNSRSKSTTTPSYGADVPPNAEAGKCYARCQTEDQYSYKTKQVVSSPKMVKRIKLPALYNTVYDTIITRAQSTRSESIPATYETIKQQKMVSPTTTKWVKGKADAGCLSANPDDCQVMCLVEVPATYTTTTKKVLKNKAYSRTITVPMEYKVVTKQVKTQNERFIEQVIPATYKTVQERIISKKGGYQGWREILCGNDLTPSKISAIQRALKGKGYNPGPIDNVFGTQTKEALKSYQRAKGLPVGNLNLETLRSLGL